MSESAREAINDAMSILAAASYREPSCKESIELLDVGMLMLFPNFLARKRGTVVDATSDQDTSYPRAVISNS